tara:strand:- start:5370 stop:6512 length:1143 start_codon:yes stop_codon:yes gene_type:complete
MSRILKRPMFRGGGRANSKGTGITSGLENRIGYSTAGIVGGDQNYGRVRVEPGGEPLDVLGFLKNIFKGENVGAGQMSRTQDKKTTDTTDNTTTATTTTDTTDATTKDDTTKTNDQKIKTDIGEYPEGITAGRVVETPKDDPSPNNLFDDDDLYNFNEQEIKERAKIYEEMLGKSKKDKFFDALIAAAPGLLEGDYAKAIAGAGEATRDDTDRQAKLLAIQEEIEMRKQRLKLNTPTTLMRNIEYLQTPDGGNLSVEESINRLAPVGTSFQKDYTPGRQIFEFTEGFQDNINSFIADNAAGYGQGAFLATNYQIPVAKYSFNKDNKRVRNEIGEGEIVWDPINLVFIAKKKGDTTDKFFDFDQNNPAASVKAVKQYVYGE